MSIFYPRMSEWSVEKGDKNAKISVKSIIFVPIRRERQ